MNLHTITIEQLKKQGLRSGSCYQNKLIVTNQVENLDRFKAPCRIDAVTILVCTAGELDCSINLIHYNIKADMILFNLPEDVLQIHHAEDLQAYAVLISTDFLDELNMDLKQRSDLYINIRKNALRSVNHGDIAALKPYYALLKDNINTQQSETHNIICGLVQAFCYSVISKMSALPQEYDVEQKKVMSRNKLIFSKFMDLVKLYHIQVRGVKFYADKLCITPNYLSGLIKAYTGKTASEWVNDYVILEAKMLLRDSRLNISEIAFKLHFSSQSAFGKYFKLQTGIGPKKYRNGSYPN